jgi:hypothetical protein
MNVWGGREFSIIWIQEWEPCCAADPTAPNAESPADWAGRCAKPPGCHSEGAPQRTVVYHRTLRATEESTVCTWWPALARRSGPRARAAEAAAGTAESPANCAGLQLREDGPGAARRRAARVVCPGGALHPFTITPSPHHPITPSPHHPITPSPHHPISGVGARVRRAGGGGDARDRGGAAAVLRGPGRLSEHLRVDAPRVQRLRDLQFRSHVPLLIADRSKERSPPDSPGGLPCFSGLNRNPAGWDDGRFHVRAPSRYAG